MPIYNFTVDDISPLITYTGTWGDSSHTDPQYVRYFNQTFHATQSPDSSASITFNGTGVYIYGAKRENHGSYSVTIDGQPPFNANGAGDELYEQLLFSESGLSYAQHHVVLTNTGAPSYVDVDFIVITTGDGKSDTTGQEVVLDDTAFTYDANWATDAVDNDQYAGGTEHHTSVNQATAKISFKGNAITLYGATASDHGPFSLSLDGAAAINLNGTSADRRRQTLLYRFDGLPDGDHVLEVENQSTKFLDLDQAIISSYTAVSNGSASTTTSGATSSTAAGDSSTPTVKHNSQTGIIVGVVVGVVVLLAVVAAGLFFFRRSRDRSTKSPVQVDLASDIPPQQQTPVTAAVPPNMANAYVQPSVRQLPNPPVPPPEYEVLSTTDSLGYGPSSSVSTPAMTMDGKRAWM